MDLKEVKELINFAIEKKVKHFRLEDLEFTLEDSAWQEAPILMETAPVEEVASTLKKRIEDEKRKYLDELFNNE